MITRWNEAAGSHLVRRIEDNLVQAKASFVLNWPVFKEAMARLRSENLLTRMHSRVARFNQEIIGIVPPSKPTMLQADRKAHTVSHLLEELNEFSTATDVAGQLDALIDLTYVALGRVFEMGVVPGAAFDEVHEANMRRKRGKNARRPDSAPYDAVKPEGWVPPDLEPALTASAEDLRFIHDNRDLFEKFKKAMGLIAEANKRLDHAAKEKQVAFQGYKEQVEEAFPMKYGDKPVTGRWAAPRRHRMKLLVMGYARHGKDTVAEMLRDKFGFTFTSSSLFCAEKVIMPALAKDFSVSYKNAKECMEGRETAGDYFCIPELKDGKWRGYWFDRIAEYNSPDRSRLGREIFQQFDLYAGIRSRAEFNALKNIGAFDAAIWVDRSDHLPPEDRKSCTVEPWMADFVVDNNGDLKQLEFNVVQLMSRLLTEPETAPVPGHPPMEWPTRPFKVPGMPAPWFATVVKYTKDYNPTRTTDNTGQDPNAGRPYTSSMGIDA